MERTMGSLNEGPTRYQRKKLPVIVQPPEVVSGEHFTYLVEEEIGSGAHALVYRAVTRETLDEVALKFSRSYDPRTVNNLKNEVKILRDLPREHVINVMDVSNKCEDRYFFVLEMAPFGSAQSYLRSIAGDRSAPTQTSGGKSLSSYTTENSFSRSSPSNTHNSMGLAEPVVARMLLSVTTAVAAIHDLGWRHRDLKAANLLVMNEEGDVKLCDFGLAEKVVVEAPKPGNRETHVDPTRNPPSQKQGLDGQKPNAASAGVPGNERSTGDETENSAALRSRSDSKREGDRENAEGNLDESRQNETDETATDGPAGDEEKPAAAAPAPSFNTDGDDEKKNEWAGSVYWMSPEAVRGETQTLASDIWSLGCIVVELLTGRPPFSDRNPTNALYTIAESTEIPPVSVPVSDYCRNFLSMCLQRDPTKRATARELMGHPWLGEVAAGKTFHSLKRYPRSEEISAKSDDICKWVEGKLLHNLTESREQWLRSDDLQTAIKWLPDIIPHCSFFIVRCIAAVAKRASSEGSCLLQQLGESTLWSLPNLNALAKADDLAEIFCVCCESQGASVPHFAPSDPNALMYLLGCGVGDVAVMCTHALYQLLIAPPSEDPKMRETPTQPSDSNGSSALNRTAADSEDPTSGRTTNLTSPLTNNGSAQATPSRNGQNRGKSPNATLPPAVSRASAPRMNTLGDADQWSMGKPLPPSWTPTSYRQYTARNRLVQDGAVPVIQSVVCAVCTTAFDTRADPHLGWEAVDRLLEILVCIQDAVPLANVGFREVSTGVPLLESDKDADPQEGASVTANKATRVNRTRLAQETTKRRHLWVKALREASWRGCRHGAILLLRYAKQRFDELASGLITTDDYAPEAPSIAGTFVLLSSDATLSTEMRTDLMQMLPKLQNLSSRTAEFLRDTTRSVPMLIHSFKHLSPMKKRDFALEAIMRLIANDKQMAVALSQQNFIVCLVERIRIAKKEQRYNDCLNGFILLEALFAETEETAVFLTMEPLASLLMAIAVEDPASIESSSLKGYKEMRSAAMRLHRALEAETTLMV